MKPKTLLRTTAVILALGLASVAGAQSNDKDQNDKKPDAAAPKQAGHGRQAARGQQPQQAARGQRPQPTAASRPQGASGQRQAQAQGQGQQRRQAQQVGQAGQARTAAQGYRGRGAGQAGQPQTAVRSQSQRTVGQRATGQSARGQVSGSQGQAAAPLRNHLTPAPRQVVTAPTQQRSGGSGMAQGTVWPRYRAQTWSSQHRTWVQRGGYSGYRIPTASFGLYFGRPHRFHLSSYRVRVVGSYPEFYADGFWFTMLDPVPEYWGSDWYDSDYVTIVQGDDGYYLLDESYPDAQVAISVQIG